MHGEPSNDHVAMRNGMVWKTDDGGLWPLEGFTAWPDSEGTIQKAICEPDRIALLLT